MANTPQLDDKLRDAGLKVKSLFRSLVSRTLGSHGSSSHVIPTAKYHGKVKVALIPQVIATIRQGGENVTQREVARRLGCRETTFQMVLKRYPEIRVIYTEAINDPLLFPEK